MTNTYKGPIITPCQLVKDHLSITLASFGVKTGMEWPKADLYIDCRGVANPMHTAGLCGTGDEGEVQEWVRTYTDVFPYYDIVREALTRLTTRRGEGKEFDKPFHIVTMCAHGIHRSRAMKHIIGKHLTGLGFKVEVK